MPPFTANGTFTAILSESDKVELSRRRNEELIRDANIAIGPYLDNPRAVSNDHPGRAKAVVTGLYQTAEGLSRAFARAAEFADSSLSPEGLAEARRERTEAVSAAVKRRIDSLREHLDEAYEVADKAAEPFRPKFDPNDVAQSIRTDQAWNNVIKPQLAAGKGWHQIIPTLDHDGILAAQRFAPSHEAASRGTFEQHQVAPIMEGILRTSEKRVIELAPEGPARDAMQTLENVRKYRDAASSSIEALTAVTTAVTEVSVTGNVRLASDTATAASVQIKRATYEVGAQPQSAEPTQAA